MPVTNLNFIMVDRCVNLLNLVWKIHVFMLTISIKYPSVLVGKLFDHAS